MYSPPFAAGGAEMVAWRLTRRLLAAGHQVLVLSACQDFDKSGWRQVDGVDVFVFSRYNLRWRGWRGVCNPAVLKILNKKLLSLVLMLSTLTIFIPIFLTALCGWPKESAKKFLDRP